MRILNKAVVLAMFVLLCSFVFRADRITIYLIGDSTVCIQPVSQAPVTGWGTPFAVFPLTPADLFATVLNQIGIGTPELTSAGLLPQGELIEELM